MDVRVSTSQPFDQSEIDAGKARHLARLAHAHRRIYGTNDLHQVHPMARAQIAKIESDWSDSTTLPRLVAVDRLSRPAN